LPKDDAQPKEVERTLDELKAELDKALRTVKNREEEAARVHAKLEKFEKEEQARKEAEMTEMDKLKLQVENAEKEVATYRKTLMKREIASKYELPEVLIDRLQGETPEEMETDAKKLVDELPKAIKQSISPTNPGSNQSIQETDKQRFDRLFGSQNK